MTRRRQGQGWTAEVEDSQRQTMRAECHPVLVIGQHREIMFKGMGQAVHVTQRQ